MEPSADGARQPSFLFSRAGQKLGCITDSCQDRLCKSIVTDRPSASSPTKVLFFVVVFGSEMCHTSRLEL